MVRLALAAMLAAVLTLALGAHERGPWSPIGKGPASAVVPPASGIPINVQSGSTQYMQAVVNANTPGVSPGCIPNCTFLIKAGTHRMQKITPRSGDVYTSETNAIMSGSRDLTPGVVTWTSQAMCTSHTSVPCWYVDGQTQRGSLDDCGANGTHTCAPGQSGCSGKTTIEGTTWFPTCFYPEDVYFDGAFKYHCQVYANCPAGGWYLDYDGGGAYSMSPQYRLYVFDNPAGHTVEASVSPIAFDNVSNVTIQGLIVERYATPYAGAAITVTDGMVLNGVEGRYNHYAATANGSNGNIKNSHLHHNLCVGDRGGGNAQFGNDEFDHNNYFLEYDEFWGCGGTKWNVAQGGMKILNSYTHNNIGPGFWCDTSCDGLLYDSNTIDDNSRAGIFQEIGYSATITNNTIRRNGYGNGTFYTPCPGCNTAYPTESGVALSSSNGVEVAFNTLIDNYGSIQGVQDDRCSATNQPGQSPGRFWYLQNMNIHDNTISSTVNLNMGVPPSNGIVRSGDSACPNPFAAGSNNKWVHNTYTFGSFTNLWFVWEFGSFNRYTTAQWQAIPQDATGTFH